MLLCTCQKSNCKYTVVIEDLHSRLKELHGWGFEILLAFVEACNHLIEFGLTDKYRQSGHGAAHEMLHPALRSCQTNKQKVKQMSCRRHHEL